MRQLVKTLKWIYDFLCGDSVLLTTVLIAFASTAVLVRYREETPLLVIALVGLIAVGLLVAIGKELARWQHEGAESYLSASDTSDGEPGDPPADTR